MNDFTAAQCAGQLIFFEKTERAKPKSRQVMSKVGLAAAFQHVSTPAAVDEIIQLPWDDYHAVLAMLALAPSIRIQWAQRHLNLLRSWSEQVL